MSWILQFCTEPSKYVVVFDHELLPAEVSQLIHDDVIKLKHLPCYWSFLSGIHRSLVDSPLKVQWRGGLVFSLIYAKGWANKGDAGDMTRHCAHYDVSVMVSLALSGLLSNTKTPYVLNVDCELTKDTHIKLFGESYGVPILSISENIDRVITAPHCIRHLSFQLQQQRYCSGMGCHETWRQRPIPKNGADGHKLAENSQHCSESEKTGWRLLTPTPTNYNDVIVCAIASQITSLTIVHSIVYSDADQRKHQSSE